MKCAAIILATLLCASCGGGSGSSSNSQAAPTSPPAATSSAPPPPTATDPPPAPAPTPPPPTPDPPSQPVLYTLVDLGTLGGNVTPHGINNHDDVVGTSVISGGGGQAFLYLSACSCMQDLALSPGELSDAWAVDDHDTVAMDSAPGQNEPYGPAILWRSGGRFDLPSTNPQVNQYGTPYAINSSGVVVGSAWSAAGSAHATLWTPHGDSYTATDLGTLGGSFSRALSVNGHGDAVGTSDTGQQGGTCQSGGGDPPDHAFLYQHGKLEFLGSLSPLMDDSQASGINDSEEIVGSSEFGDCQSNSAGLLHAFLWKNGSMIDLGTLAGNGEYESAADGINDGGEIVGYSDINAQHVHHAFLYSGGKMQDLNSLIDPGDPLRPYVTLTEATAINCAGDIAASGSDSRDGSHQHGYLVLREGPPPGHCSP
jgi:chitinase